MTRDVEHLPPPSGGKYQATISKESDDIVDSSLISNPRTEQQDSTSHKIGQIVHHGAFSGTIGPMIAPTEGALSVLEFGSSSWPGLGVLGILLALVLAIVFLLWYVLPVILRVVEIRRLKRSCLKNKLIALTWDDGPSEGMTMRLLALLDAHDCPATFLLSGSRVLARPDLVNELVSRGHQIGSHGFKPRPKCSCDTLAWNARCCTWERCTALTWHRTNCFSPTLR